MAGGVQHRAMTKAPNVKKITGSPREPSKWIVHVRKYKQEHKTSWKIALKEAGATYTKLDTKPKKEKGEWKPNPWIMHIAKWRNENPEWRKTFSYKQVLQKCKETYKSDKQPVAQPE